MKTENSRLFLLTFCLLAGWVSLRAQQAAAVSVSIRVENAQHKQQKDVIVYAVYQALESDCNCPECFKGANYGACDINLVKNMSWVQRLEPDEKDALYKAGLGPGAYFFFVTRLKGESEAVIYRKKKTVNKDSLIKLTLPKRRSKP